MSIEISREIEARLTEEARRQGISVNALLEQLINERAYSIRAPAKDGRFVMNISAAARNVLASS